MISIEGMDRSNLRCHFVLGAAKFRDNIPTNEQLEGHELVFVPTISTEQHHLSHRIYLVLQVPIAELERRRARTSSAA